MKPIHARFWTIAGYSGVAIAALAVAVAMIDPVPAAFLLAGAVSVGGISGLGLYSTAKFGVTTLVVCTVVMLGMMHYIESQGLVAPTLMLLRHTFELIAIPLTISGGLLILGVIRRRRRPDPQVH